MNQRSNFLSFKELLNRFQAIPSKKSTSKVQYWLQALEKVKSESVDS